MTNQFSVRINGWSPGAPIPARFAFGKPGTDGPFATSDNVSPAIHWSAPPLGTLSFVILCHDPDVPSSGEDVNQVGKTVPADLPRVDFFHWVLIDIPRECEGLAEGAAATGVTPRGKSVGRTEHGVTGSNSYTQWFAGDADMEGTYGGYDGPCPPWNDSIVHHYHYTVYALDVESLSIPDGFSGLDVRRAMEGHILGHTSYVGTYSMNPAVPA